MNSFHHSLHHSLLEWFNEYQRNLPWRRTNDPWAIWVSEVMLQQTRVETVVPYFNQFMASFPTPQHLADATMDSVLKHWEGLGYYARARNLHSAAQQVVAAHQGTVPKNVDEFSALKGVGPYILAAVQSIAFNHPMAAVDGNVKRVIARLQLCSSPVNVSNSHLVYQPMADRLLNHSSPGDHNQAMMELGARICTPTQPACDICPVATFCTAKNEQKVHRVPVRVKKQKVPTRRIAVGVIQKGKKLLICKRKDDGLLGGLWEFPGGGVEKGENSHDACIREIQEEVNLQVQIQSQLTTIHHAYTHFKIIMDVFVGTHTSGRVRLNGPQAFAWVHPASLSKYAFPKANNKFIPLLLEHIGKQNGEK